ncbi:MAG: hypothetical protein HOW73_28335 [Polyangiaceae bacterium]|nr:hypothetical protein [Polyangiaceae bacterium]
MNRISWTAPVVCSLAMLIGCGDDTGTGANGGSGPEGGGGSTATNGGENPGGQNAGGENPGGQNAGGQNAGGQNAGGQNAGGGGAGEGGAGGGSSSELVETCIDACNEQQECPEAQPVDCSMQCTDIVAAAEQGDCTTQLEALMTCAENTPDICDPDCDPEAQEFGVCFGMYCQQNPNDPACGG